MKRLSSCSIQSVGLTRPYIEDKLGLPSYPQYPVQWGFFLADVSHWWFSKITGSVPGQSACSLDLSCQVTCLEGVLRGPFGRALFPSQPCDHAPGRWSGWLWSGVFFGDVLKLLLQLGSGSAFLLPVLLGLAVCTCNFHFVTRLTLPGWVDYWGQWRRTNLDLSPCWEYLLVL